MYAIVEIAGQQFKVSEKQEVFVNRIDSKEGSKIILDKVLLLDKDGKIDVGVPTLKGVGVTAKIVEHLKSDKVLVFNAIPAFEGSSIIFEGATADNFETTISVTDPTADRTITFADESGTVISTGSADAVTEAMMANDAIGQNELKSVVTLQILNSSGTPLKTLYGAGA